MIFIIVSERSVIKFIDKTVESIIKHNNNCLIKLIVPTRDIILFNSVLNVFSDVEVISEELYVDGFNIDEIGSRLGPYSKRAGWYLQQLVKLNLARSLLEDRYIVWDSDTIQLQPINFFEDGKMCFNKTRNFHKQYLETIEKLFMNSIDVQKSSYVSQFMPIDTLLLKRMFREIEELNSVDHWFEAVLDCLPHEGQSEFSEYETFANFALYKNRKNCIITKRKWFLYGSEILNINEVEDLGAIERTFDGYSYVSFERHHKKSLLKLLFASIRLKLRISS